MRVCLASSPHRDTFGYSMPPPGLLRLGGELLRRGRRVELEDLAFRLASGRLSEGDGLARDAAELLLERGAPDVLGLSTMGATLPAALAIAREVRARAPRTRVVLGGPGVGGIDAPLVERFDFVDAVVRGEGERTLEELLARYERGQQPRGVAGVTWRDADGRARREADRPPLADLGELADCAWELLPPLAEYKRITGEEEGLVPLDSGRGCTYDCSFCSIGRFWGRRSRPLPVERLVREVEAVRDREGGKRAYLCHDLFGADRRHARAFCDALIERGSGVPWECRARVDHLDAELLERMGRAGCVRVLFGIESADPDVRDVAGKRMDRELDVVAAVERCVANGITPILSLILGLPGEDEAGLRATLDLAASAVLVGGVHLSFHLVNPQPSCALGDEHGAGSRPVEGIPPDMAWGAGETAPERELIRAHPDLFSTWALLTSLPGGEEHLRDLARLAGTLPELLMRYPRTFALVARARSADTLDLYRALAADGRSFEAAARLERDARIDATLRWEQACLRAAARGPSGAGSAAGEGPRRRGELVRSAFDLAGLTRAALAADALPEPEPARERSFVVQRGERGIRTLAVSDDAAALLDLCDGSARARDLTGPGSALAPAVASLARAGLVALPSPVRSTDATP